MNKSGNLSIKKIDNKYVRVEETEIEKEEIEERIHQLKHYNNTLEDAIKANNAILENNKKELKMLRDILKNDNYQEIN